jgi:hypothetical protein
MFLGFSSNAKVYKSAKLELRTMKGIFSFEIHGKILETLEA